MGQLKEEYIILLQDKRSILYTDDFLQYLRDEKDVDFGSSIKSKCIYILVYFTTHTFSRDNFRRMLGELREGVSGKIPLKTRTLNKYIMVGKYIDSYLRLNIIQDYPRLKSREPSEQKGDLLSPSEMKSIVRCYIKHGPRGSDRDRIKNLIYTTAIELMHFYGMSPDDVVNLKWSNDKVSYLEVYRHKTGEIREIPILPTIRALLDQLPRQDHGYIMAFDHVPMAEQTIRKEIQKRALKLGINKWVTCYSFRYSMITWCDINASSDGDVAKIAKISGHSIQTAMKHYAKHDIKSLEDVLYATHPNLIKRQPIDSAKRIIMTLVGKFIDLSKYEVEIHILPKKKGERFLRLS